MDTPITTKRRRIPASGQLVTIEDLAIEVKAGRPWQVWWPGDGIEDRRDRSWHWRDASGLFGNTPYPANLKSTPSALVTIARPTPQSEQ